MENREEVRNILNTVFLLLALIGVVVYFAFPAHHIIGLVVIGIAMIIKVIKINITR